jgi:NADH:ubiquinone oxidoreductase subunit
MALKDALSTIFTWWNGQTAGTRFYTWRFGNLIGQDEFGNRYYRAPSHQIDAAMGPERRWVVYSGLADLSAVPPGWRGWLSHTVDVPPNAEAYTPREWEKPYLPNQTGTENAYRPRGSQLSVGQRPAATGDYVPWTPRD